MYLTDGFQARRKFTPFFMILMRYLLGHGPGKLPLRWTKISKKDASVKDSISFI